MEIVDTFLLVLIANISLLFLPSAVVGDEDRPRIVTRERSLIFRRGPFTSPDKLCKEGQGGIEVVNNPPEFVYRADFRPPSEIFKNGMKSLGKNDGLLDHMKGVSTKYGPKKDSLFVSTSAVEAGAIKWAETQMKNKNNQAQKSIFVYKIRADASYFSMFESLLNAFRQTGNKEYETQANMVAKFYDEWEACGGVKAEEILSATEYQRDPTNNPQSSYLRAVGSKERDNKKPKNTQGNQHPFVPSHLRVKQ